MVCSVVSNAVILEHFHLFIVLTYTMKLIRTLKLIGYTSKRKMMNNRNQTIDVGAEPQAAERK